MFRIYTLMFIVAFQLTVYARDYGTPRLQSFEFATVTITVIRNNNGPVFQNVPYSRTISQSISSGTSVFKVTATDADVVSSVDPCEVSLIELMTGMEF